MPRAKNMDIDVIVTRDSGSPKGVSFGLNAGHGKTHTVRFDNDHHPGIMVYFNIKDPDDTGLEFKSTPSNAVWVNSLGTGCPTTQCIWNQFLPLSVEEDSAGKKTQLIVYCRNKAVKDFAFTLLFNWPDGREVDYDPIGNGSNGPRS